MQTSSLGLPARKLSRLRYPIGGLGTCISAGGKTDRKGQGHLQRELQQSLARSLHECGL